MADALDERRIVNVVIARQPVVPALPVWPAWIVLMVGFLGAGVSGTGIAFVADYLDPAFRTPDEVLAYLRAPVLASLPREIKSLENQPDSVDDIPGKRPSRGVRGSWKGTA